jgi:hypothetical protein
MRLAAIFVVWNDWDWLKIATKNISSQVDDIIIVASEKSTWGEFSPIPDEWRNEVEIREPFFNHPLNCETDKRNYGLDIAKRRGFTHFICLDADELYEPNAFLKAKERFHVEHDLQGLVCRTQVYFKSPELTLGLDHTLVPFIHKIQPGIRHEFNKKYPYAWENGNLHIDPSRSLNINSGVKMDDIIMHHYSYLRVDLAKKIRNSTARRNIEKSKTLWDDYNNAAPGMYCEYYRTTLKKCDNIFNLPYFHNPTDRV